MDIKEKRAKIKKLVMDVVKAIDKIVVRIRR